MKKIAVDSEERGVPPATAGHAPPPTLPSSKLRYRLGSYFFPSRHEPQILPRAPMHVLLAAALSCPRAGELGWLAGKRRGVSRSVDRREVLAAAAAAAATIAAVVAGGGWKRLFFSCVFWPASSLLSSMIAIIAVW